MSLFRPAFIALALLCSALATADPLWIDVRSPEEYQQDHIAGDPNVPHTGIAQQIESLAPDKDQEIVLYCARGGRAGVAQKTLEQMGYTHVRNAGGIADARKERCADTRLASACTPGATP
jgi:phage shock protein E